MDHKRHRLSISLRPETHDVLSRLARVQGRSIAAIAREVLEATQDPFGRIAAFLEALERQKALAEDGRKGALRAFKEDVAEAERETTAKLQELLRQADRFVQGQASGEASGGSQPPSTNRGVRSGGENAEKGSKRPRGRGRS